MRLLGQRKALGPEKRAWLKAVVFTRDGYRCMYCGSRKDLQLDHIKPVIYGQEDTPENMVTACARCNLSKGCRTPEEWIADRPRYLPARLRGGYCELEAALRGQKPAPR